jgi:hypothetical protein
MNNAEKLIKEIERKKEKWNERSQFTFKKVGNLSMSDLDTIKIYAETFNRTGRFEGLMKPIGGVKEVLSMYGIE